MRTYDGTSRGMLAKIIATFIHTLMYEAFPRTVSKTFKFLPAGGLAKVIRSLQAPISTTSIRSALKTSPSMR
jgi:hypothetical protein